MKWFCYLFSFYILLLSGLPCTDGNCDQLEQNSCASSTAIFLPGASSSVPQHGHDFDSCSPVCACHCCSVSFTVRSVEPVPFFWYFASVVKQMFPDRSVRIKDVALTIDHPPQLV